MFIGSTFVLKLNDTGEEMAEALPEEETGREDGSDGELKNDFLACFVSFGRLAKRAGKSGNVGGYRDALTGGIGGGGGKEGTEEHGHVPLTTGTGKKI